MKNVTRSIPFKVVIFILTALFLLTSVTFGIGAVVMEEIRHYSYSQVQIKEDLFSDILYEESYKAFNMYRYGHHILLERNLRYSITDIDGNVVADNGIAEANYIQTYHYYRWDVSEIGGHESFTSEYISEGDELYRAAETATVHYTVLAGYAETVSGGNLYWIDTMVDTAFDALAGGWLSLTAGVSAILTVVCMIALCCVSGRRKGSEEAVLLFANRIPFDLFLAALVAAGVGLFSLAVVVLESEIIYLYMICLPALGFALSCLLVWLISSFAARVKAGGLFRKTLIGRIFSRRFRWGVKGIKALFRLIRKIPTVPTVSSIAGFLAFCNILLGFFSFEILIFFLLTLESIIGFLLAVAIAVGFSKVQKQAKHIADGDLTNKTDTRYLAGPLKQHAEDLNRIGDGLNAAVNERIKSERMKTELITNVSHDIKTPLTSIINYVDLLSKETEMNEKTAEYLLILQRQSARLKKLTEDIVEASKASSGSITLTPAPCDLGVLLEQTVGEYEEKTKEQNLNVILSKPETPITVIADGKRLWRVFDNLMNNICKYALPGTRVYLTLSADADKAVITFRNISKDPLNIDPNELTERFVRGDASRSSEGSGLGLAIARSLTELQKGTFDITIDADLFKVTVQFPLLNVKE